MQSGIVKFWNDEKGFGFIGRGDGVADIFVHVNELAGSADELRVGQSVSFEEKIDDRRGKLNAVNVRVT